MLVRVSTGMLLLLITLTAGAELPLPQGPVILTMDGRIQIHNVAGTAEFDRAMLEALPQKEVSTTSPWTEGSASFRGVLMRDLLAAVGAQGDTVQAVALNDYAIEIPAADFREYDVILAMDRDGKPMRVRDKGPLWIIYPLDDHAELRNSRYHARMIWQLKHLTVQ